jgi:hypothetical protein
MQATSPNKPSPSQMGTAAISPFMVRHIKKSAKPREIEKKQPNPQTNFRH